VNIPAIHAACRRLQQRLAKPGRYYGNGGTIHSTTHLDVEVDDLGHVVAVWFRCQPLPFMQTNVAPRRGVEMQRMYAESPMPGITGVEVVDPS
jgi:hypothetical protein